MMGRQLLRRAAQRLPASVREALWRRTVGRRSSVRWGNMRRTEPFSRVWGADRGLPVDRVYIERFLAEHATDIGGHGLEVLEPIYLERFGGDRMTSVDVIDIDASNTRATIVGDLADTETLRGRRFDCVILTQTLQYIANVEPALANAYRSLAADGVMLLTVPGISQLETTWDDLWRWTPLGLRQLLARALPPEAEREVTGHGNALVSTAFLMGLSADDLDEDEFEDDPHYPLVVCARVGKPAGVPEAGDESFARASPAA